MYPYLTEASGAPGVLHNFPDICLEWSCLLDKPDAPIVYNHSKTVKGSALDSARFFLYWKRKEKDKNKRTHKHIFGKQHI